MMTSFDLFIILIRNFLTSTCTYLSYKIQEEMKYHMKRTRASISSKKDQYFVNNSRRDKTLKYIKFIVKSPTRLPNTDQYGRILNTGRSWQSRRIVDGEITLPSCIFTYIKILEERKQIANTFHATVCLKDVQKTPKQRVRYF